MFVCFSFIIIVIIMILESTEVYKLLFKDIYITLLQNCNIVKQQLHRKGKDILKNKK